MIQIKNYKQLSFLSSFSNILILGTVSVIIVDSVLISFGSGLKNEEEVIWWSSSGMFVFTIKFMNSLEGIAVVPGLYASARKKSQVDQIFKRIYQSSFLVSMTMSVLAYYAHRGGTREIVIMNLRYGVLSHFLQLAFMVSLLCSYVLQLFPVLEIVENYRMFATPRGRLWVFESSQSNLSVLVRVAILSCTFLVATSVKDLGIIMAVNGSVFGSMLQYIMPALLYLEASKNEKGTSSTQNRVLSYFIVINSLIISCVGLYFTF